MSTVKRIALIPARGGSKGIAEKNLSLIGGVSLLEWAVRTAVESNQFDTIYIDTDDANIQEIGLKLGCQVPRLRPAEFATDESSIIDAITDFLEFISAELDCDETCIVLLQPTSPFRKGDDLQRMIEEWNVGKRLNSVVSVSNPIQSPKDFIMLSSTGAWVPAFAPDFKVTNRQQISEYKFITGGIYVFSKRFIEEHGSLVVTGKTQFYDCGPLSGVDIDNLQDLLIARALFEFGLSNF